MSKQLIIDFVPQYVGVNLKDAWNELNSKGFSLLYSNEHFPYLRFYDIGAIVYFAKIIEWEFPGFSVEGCFEALSGLQEELEDKSYIESLEHRFIIVCENVKTYF